jgi:hypothetical protein
MRGSCQVFVGYMDEQVGICFLGRLAGHEYEEHVWRLWRDDIRFDVWDLGARTSAAIVSLLNDSLCRDDMKADIY